MTREQRSLRLAALLLMILFGLTCALSAFAPLSGPMGVVLDAVFWPLDERQGTAASETRLLLAILGGITFGWGLMIWQLAGAPLARDPEMIRPIIRNAVIGWFILDSAGSFLAGAPLNVAANVPFAAMFLVPLMKASNPALRV